MCVTKTDFFPALRYRALNPLYDLVAALTTRERAFKKRLLVQAAIEPGCDVLDLGCGTGTLTFAVKRHQNDAHVVGLDGDPAILEIARRKQRQHRLDVEFTDGLSYALPFAAETFDRALCSLLLHHMPPRSKAKTLVEIRRVLRPGGQLHIADWGAATGPLTRAMFAPVQKLDGKANTIDHVDGRLPNYLTEAGFERVEIQRDYFTVFGILSLFSCRKRSVSQAS
jgi:ubiquinone/menaquinone biosynthesis C-methylase UbiE